MNPFITVDSFYFYISKFCNCDCNSETIYWESPELDAIELYKVVIYNYSYVTYSECALISLFSICFISNSDFANWVYNSVRWDLFYYSTNCWWSKVDLSFWLSNIISLSFNSKIYFDNSITSFSKSDSLIYNLFWSLISLSWYSNKPLLISDISDFNYAVC